MQILIIIVFIIGIADFIFNISSFISTKRLVSSKIEGMDQKFIFENIIHTRSSLRLVFSLLVIIASVLSALGIKALDDIRQNVAEDVKKNLIVSIDSLSMKLQTIDSLYKRAKEVDGNLIQYFEHNKLFIIRDLVCENEGQKFIFKDMSEINGLVFNSPPSVLIQSQKNVLTIKEITKDYIIVGYPVGTDSHSRTYFDFWICYQYNYADASIY